MQRIIKLFFNWRYKWFPPPMVSYWMHGDMARAKVVHAKDGSYRMQIEGEKYPYPGFPRGHILFGSLARLKNRTKNILFNDIWARLENGEYVLSIQKDLRKNIFNQLIDEIELCIPDMIPPEKMVPAIQELWRAMTAVENKLQTNKFFRFKQGLTFFLQEDDAYRFRFQWISKYLHYYSFFKKIDLRTEIKRVMKLLENAEIVSDMKGRIVLIARIVSLLLEDDEINQFANEVFKELNFKKVKLSKADKYYFRGKYFKVDHSHYEY